MTKKLPVLLLSVLIVAIVLAACGSSSSYSVSSSAQIAPSAAPAAAMTGFAREGGYQATANDMAAEAPLLRESMPAASEAPAPGGGVAGPSVKQSIDARKIIRNVDIRLQTQGFDAGVESIPRLAESFGGHVQDSYIEGRDMYNERGNRSASFTVRIPVEQLDSFVNSIGGEFHVISRSQNSVDITENYYDSKARLDALKIQEERLLEMLKQAAELEYLLQVEKELMNVRYEIESLTSSLNRMDSNVSMSTVSIYLNEVVKYEPIEDVPVTFVERINRAFVESWKNFSEFSKDFAVMFVGSIPALLVIAVIIVIVVLIIRASAKHHERRKDQNLTANLPPPPTPPETKSEEQ